MRALFWFHPIDEATNLTVHALHTYFQNVAMRCLIKSDFEIVILNFFELWKILEHIHISFIFHDTKKNFDDFDIPNCRF